MKTRPGIVSLLGGLVSALAFAALIVSCGGRGKGSGEAAADAARSDSLAATVNLNEGGYAMLEPIVMTLEVANTTGRTVHLTFPTAQRYDFVVKKGKETIWQWSEGRMFAQFLGRYELAPGDAITYRHVWDQTKADGTKPGLGAYTVEGILMIAPPLKTPAKTFGIVD
jgi:hypothetical protein